MYFVIGIWNTFVLFDTKLLLIHKITKSIKICRLIKNILEGTRLIHVRKYVSGNIAGNEGNTTEKHALKTSPRFITHCKSLGMEFVAIKHFA